MSGFVCRFRLKEVEQALLRACRLTNRSTTSAPPNGGESRKWPSSIRRAGKLSARCSTICWTSTRASARAARRDPAHRSPTRHRPGSIARSRDRDRPRGVSRGQRVAERSDADRQDHRQLHRRPPAGTRAWAASGSRIAATAASKVRAVKFLNLALMGRGGTERFRREGQVLAKLAPGYRASDRRGHRRQRATLSDAGIRRRRADRRLVWTRTHLISSRACVVRRGAARCSVRAQQPHPAPRFEACNILVTREGRVKLLDFGIAKLLDDRTQVRSRPSSPACGTRVYTGVRRSRADPGRGRDDGDRRLCARRPALPAAKQRAPTALPTVAAAEQLRAVIDNVPARLSVVVARTTQRPVQEQARTVTRRRRCAATSTTSQQRLYGFHASAMRPWARSPTT